MTIQPVREHREVSESSWGLIADEVSMQAPRNIDMQEMFQVFISDEDNGGIDTEVLYFSYRYGISAEQMGELLHLCSSFFGVDDTEESPHKYHISNYAIANALHFWLLPTMGPDQGMEVFNAISGLWTTQKYFAE